MKDITACAGQKPSNDSQPAQPTFVTDHLALASLLLCRGHQPDLSATPSGKVLFAFTQTANLQNDITEFHDGNALVQPSEYDAARIALHKGMDAVRGGGQ